MMPKYRIYPSLLDKFQSLIDYEHEAEQPWNIVSENAHKQGRHLDKEVGDYILSPDVMYDKIEVELINQINRCPKEPNEAADKGTAFNEIVDCLIENRKSSRSDIDIHSEKIDDNTTAIIAAMNGFSFAFDTKFCREAATYFKGAITQHLCKSNILTKYGDVELYGYIDEWLPNKICDIKTTGSYTFGKFERKWQRYVYPYCVIESGEATQVDEFEYTVYVWDKTPLLTATQYKEVYTYIHKQSAEKIRDIVERFIWWLNLRKEFITDKRIFGGENPEDYIGTPINVEQLKIKI